MKMKPIRGRNRLLPYSSDDTKTISTQNCHLLLVAQISALWRPQKKLGAIRELPNRNKKMLVFLCSYRVALFDSVFVV